MPRKARVDEKHRERFLATLGEAGTRTGWRMHAFVLIRESGRRAGK